MKKKNDIKNPFLRLLGNKRWQPLSIPIFAILCSLVVSAIIILAVGKNPLIAFKSLLQGAGVLGKPKYAAFQGQLTEFMETLDSMTPMIFAALAVAAAMKAGIFNIGVSGQMLMAGFIASITVGYSGLNSVIAKPLVIIVGIITGGIVGGLIGFLNYKFNINAVVSSIMLNYIIQYIVAYFINTKYIDAISRQSKSVNPAARLTLMGVEFGGIKMRIPIFFIFAIIVAIILKFYFDRTKGGFELGAVGLSPNASSYAGINIGSSMIKAMVISGALAGLAGVTYYLGYHSSIRPKTLTSVGYDAIAVALLGNNNPIGIIFSSFLITVIERGGTYMKSIAGVEQEIASLISGTILLFSSCSAFIRLKINSSVDKKLADLGLEEEEG